MPSTLTRDQLDQFNDCYLTRLLYINDAGYFNLVLSELAPEDRYVLEHMDANLKKMLASAAIHKLHPTATVFDVISNLDPHEESNIRALLSACKADNLDVFFATEHMQLRAVSNFEATVIGYEDFVVLFEFAIRTRHPLISLFVAASNQSQKASPLLYTIYSPSEDLISLITHAVIRRALNEVKECYSFDEELASFLSSCDEYSLVEICIGTLECEGVANGLGMKLYCTQAAIPAQSTEATYGTFKTSRSDDEIPPSRIQPLPSPLPVTSSTLSAYMQYNGVTYLVTSGHGHSQPTITRSSSIARSILHPLCSSTHLEDKMLFASTSVVPGCEELCGRRRRSDGTTEEVTMFAFPKGSVQFIASIWPMAGSFQPSRAELLRLNYAIDAPSHMLRRQDNPSLLFPSVFCLADVSIFRLDESLAALWSTASLPSGVKVIDLNTDPMVMAEEDGEHYALPADVDKKVDGKTVIGVGSNTETEHGELNVIGFGTFSRVCKLASIHEILYYGRSLQPLVGGDAGTPLVQSGVCTRTLHSFFKGRISNYYMSTPAEMIAKQVLHVLRAQVK